MDPKLVSERVLKVLAGFTRKEPEEISLGNSLADDLGIICGPAIFELVTALEEEFLEYGSKNRFDPYMFIEGVQTVKGVVSFIVSMEREFPLAAAA